jgi:hypothetical protein
MMSWFRLQKLQDRIDLFAVLVSCGLLMCSGALTFFERYQDAMMMIFFIAGIYMIQKLDRIK